MGRLITATLVVLQMLGTPLAGALGCGGWKPAPEARMACCDRAAICPMRGHATTGTPDPSPSHLAQAEADACCAAADTSDAPPILAFGLPPLTATTPLLPTALPAFRRIPPRDDAPPGPAIARHLLLSVILV